MNRGLSVYWREGNRYAKETFKKHKFNYIKSIFIVVIDFLALFLIPLYPIMILFNKRLARISKAKRDIYILKAFEGSNKKEAYGNVIKVFLVKFLLFLGGLITILLFAALLFGIGFAAKGLSLAFNDLIFELLFTIPADILLIVYLVMFGIYFAPTYYIVDRKSDMGVSNILFNSFSSMKKGGKSTLFLIHLVYILMYILLALIFLGIPAVVFVVLFFFVKQRQLALMITIIVGAVSLLIAFFVVPKVILAHRIAVVDLFDDIVSVNEYDNEFNRYLDVKGTDLSRHMQSKDAKKVKIETQEDLLVSLFKNTNDVEEDKLNPVVDTFTEDEIINDNSLDEMDRAHDDDFIEPEPKKEEYQDPKPLKVQEEIKPIEEIKYVPIKEEKPEEVVMQQDTVHTSIQSPLDLANMLLNDENEDEFEESDDFTDSSNDNSLEDIPNEDENTSISNLELEALKEMEEAENEELDPQEAINDSNTSIEEATFTEERPKDEEPVVEDEVEEKPVTQEPVVEEASEEEVALEPLTEDEVALEPTPDELPSTEDNSINEEANVNKAEEIDEFEAFTSSLQTKNEEPEEVDEFEAFANSLQEKPIEEEKPQEEIKPVEEVKKEAPKKAPVKKTTTKKTTEKQTDDVAAKAKKVVIVKKPTPKKKEE